MTIEFQPWPKTPRFNRDVIITEKIDGTNAAIIIEPGDVSGSQEGLCAGVLTDDGFFHVGAQSRKRLIVPGDDNFGFAAWVAEHAEDLVRALGPGRHFGEWWGSGIQRGYGLPRGEKRFSLFNVHRYAGIKGVFGGLHVVPELYRGPLNDQILRDVEYDLRRFGSRAVMNGFMNPEGFIIYHTAAGQTFKVLLEGDDTHKGARA